MWKVVKIVNNTNKSDNILALKKRNSVTITSRVEKATVLGVHFAKVSGTGNYSKSFQKHKEDSEKEKKSRILKSIEKV